MSSSPELQESADLLHSLSREVMELPPPVDDELAIDMQRNTRSLGELAGDEKQFMVVVMGEFSTGKSTLINALIGRPVARMAATIETGHVSIFQYGAPERAVFHLRSGADHSLSFAQTEELLGAPDGRSSDFLAQVDSVDLYLNSEPLQAMTLVDTPGLGTVQALHEQITTRYLDNAQAIVWVFDANQAGTGTEVNYLRQIGGHRCVIGALNKVDDLDPDEVPEVQEHLMSALPGILRAVLPVSAYEALAARLSDDRDALAQSGVPQLVDYLGTEVFERQKLIIAASRAAIFMAAVQRFYTHIVRRRAQVQRLIDAYQRTDGLLRQRRQALADRARGELVAANSEFFARRRNQWTELEQRHKKDLPQLALDAENLLGPDEMEEHRVHLQDVSIRLFDEEWQTTTTQIIEETRRMVELQPGDGMFPDESFADKAGRWLSALGGGAVVGGVAGGVIAAASAVITIGILPVAIGLGAVGGLGGLVSEWLRKSARDREELAGLRREVMTALNGHQTELNRFIHESIVPSILDRSDEQEAALRARFQSDFLTGMDIERIRTSSERLVAIEQDVRRVAADHNVELRGLVGTEELRSTGDPGGQ